MIDELGIVLRADAREPLALRLRDSEPPEGILDIGRDVFPACIHAFRIGTHIGDDIVHIQTFDGRSPVRHLGPFKDLERLEAEFAHPVRIVLFLRDLRDDLRCQTA